MIGALIPVKSLSASKSRLSSVLSPAQRERLSAFMLQKVLQILRASGKFDLICLVTQDIRAAQIAKDTAARVIWEPKPGDENRAIDYATQICNSLGTESLLVLPADIPFITVQDIETILAGPTRGPKVILCPSKEGTGTNALYRVPAGVIPPRFGPNSFFHHRGEARRRTIDCEVRFLPRVALDIDTPEDLSELRKSREFPLTLLEFPLPMVI